MNVNYKIGWNKKSLTLLFT